MMDSIAPLEQIVLAPLADCGYGILQLGRLVPESLRRPLADDADPSGFRVSVDNLVIFILQTFHYFDDPHPYFVFLLNSPMPLNCKSSAMTVRFQIRINRKT
jgi:hypothetical protein